MIFSWQNRHTFSLKGKYMDEVYFIFFKKSIEQQRIYGQTHAHMKFLQASIIPFLIGII